MKKYIAIVISIIFLQSCVSQIASIKSQPLNSDWTAVVRGWTPGEVLVSNGIINTSVDFTSVVKTENNHCSGATNYRNDTISFQINYVKDGADYMFDNSKVWLISKSGRRYHLQPTGIIPNFGIYKIDSKDHINRGYEFVSPLFCNNLEGAIFETNGLYRDGKQLPPIKFRINYVPGVLDTNKNN